jgi:four helix bundle protein
MPDNIRLEDVDIYQLGLEIGEDVRQIVSEWKFFKKKTIGGQFAGAADSIAATIAEGDGRYFYKDRKQFCYYSRGSLMETKTWATKAFSRELMSKEIFDSLNEKLKTLHFKLNNYIKKFKQNVQSPNI